MPCDCSSLVSASVSVPLSLLYSLCGASRPIHTQAMPSSTSSRIVYLESALADEKT